MHLLCIFLSSESFLQGYSIQVTIMDENGNKLRRKIDPFNV